MWEADLKSKLSMTKINVSYWSDSDYFTGEGESFPLYIVIRLNKVTQKKHWKKKEPEKQNSDRNCTPGTLLQDVKIWNPVTVSKLITRITISRINLERLVFRGIIGIKYTEWT